MRKHVSLMILYKNANTYKHLTVFELYVKKPKNNPNQTYIIKT